MYGMETVQFVFSVLDREDIIVYTINSSKNERYRRREMEKYYKVLYYINRDGFQNQRDLAIKTKMSVGSINALLKNLESDGYLLKVREPKRTFLLTEAGHSYLEAALEMKQEEKLSLENKEKITLRVRKAVILAAGVNPCFELPVGMLPVSGLPLIEWMIRSLTQNGIEQIYIVVGYQKEVFEEYFKNRSNIVLIENERYKWTGTMASLAKVGRAVQGDFLLLDGNQILEETAIIKLLKAKESNCVLLTNPSDSGDEALVELNEDGSIFRISKDIRQLNSIDAELVGASKITSLLFEKMLEYYHSNQNPLLNYEYVIENIGRIYRITGVMADDMAWTIIENEDLYYKAENLIFPKIKKRERLRKENQAKETLRRCMNLKEEEIEECTIGGGMTNTNFFVKFRGGHYILRMPGAGTDVMINRINEEHNAALASALGVNPATIYFNAQTGVKITECIEEAETLNQKTARLEVNMKETTRILKALHYSDMEMYGSFHVQTEYEKYKRKIEEIHGVYYSGFEEMDSFFYEMLVRLEELGLDRRPCHNDLVAENFIKDGKGRMYLIDWEYSGYNDPMWDLASHLIECEFKPVEEELFLQYYFEGETDSISKEKIALYKICQDLLWSVWTVLKEAEGEDFGSYGEDRLRRAMKMREEYRKTYGKEK